MIKNNLTRILTLLLLFFTNNSVALEIVTTTNILGDTVKQLVGNSANVVTLMPAGIDPHLYRPTQGDVKRLLNADLIIYNGLHLEGRMQEVFDKLSTQKAILKISDGVPQKSLIKVDSNTTDPHIWMDPLLWLQGSMYLSESIAKKYPQIRNEVYTNFEIFRKKITLLNKKIAQLINEIPEKQRLLITAHDAFAYFGNRYELEVDSLQGISTVSEFGLKDIQRIKRRIASAKVKAIFLESTISPRFIKSLQQAMQQDKYNLIIGGQLFSDSLDIIGKPAGTYIGMLEHNASNISNALK